MLCLRWAPTVLIRLLFNQRISIPIMDTLIMFMEVEGFLQNPPTLMPRPDFTRLQALHHHMIEVLKQLSCPQSAIHGWDGLVMHPTVYALSKWSPSRSQMTAAMYLRCHPSLRQRQSKLPSVSLKGTRNISRCTRASTMHASRCSTTTLPIKSRYRPTPTS
jgi:hypothetical protein